MSAKTPSEGASILVVDDDPAVRQAHERILLQQGYRVVAVESAEAALSALRAAPFDAVLSDIAMPRMSGIELAREARASKMDVPIILVTGTPELQTAIDAMELGILRYLEKPVEGRALGKVMREVIREHGLARAERLALDNDGLRSLVDELHRAREGAEAGSRAKSAFLAMMSDELRTPMVAVVGHSDRLLESDLSSDQRGELRKVKGAATLMLRLLQDLLTLSDLAGGDGRVALAAFDARGIVADAVKRFEAMANAKGLLLSVGIDAGVPASLKGDGPKLALILEHLVRNAVKFTVAGRIDVRLEVASSSDNVVSLRATVVDTGVGIPEEAQARVLGVFVQGDGSTTRSRGGVGLGLAVSSQLARLMGGSLELESVVGVGTSVRFAAPFERAVAI